jgi:hypothetical protein
MLETFHFRERTPSLIRVIALWGMGFLAKWRKVNSFGFISVSFGVKEGSVTIVV